MGNSNFTLADKEPITQLRPPELPPLPSKLLAPTMNFAPYQDESPETERAMSPSLGDPRRSMSPKLQSPRVSSPVPGFSQSRVPPLNQYDGRRDVEGGRLNLGAFKTSLPIRMDVEAMLAYLLLPPAGGVFLLLVEHDSDYVRFHAWQSSMLFTAVFVSAVLESYERLDTLV